MSEKTITSYKAFDEDFSCRGFQFEVGKTYTHEGEIDLCNSGFHACQIPFDCWAYYARSTTFAVVEQKGVSKQTGDDSKRVSASITIKAQLSLPEWITAQAKTIVELCKTAAGSLAKKGHAAATGRWGHAAATGRWGHAAATGRWGHAAATGDSGHAAATGDRGHAAATGRWGHAAATGNWGHAAATGNSGHAAATGYSGHAAATGRWGHAAATGRWGHAAVEGKNSIAAALGIYSTAKAHEGGAIMLAAYAGDWNLVAVKAAMVGQDGIEAGKTYRLTTDGEFKEVA